MGQAVLKENQIPEVNSTFISLVPPLKSLSLPAVVVSSALSLIIAVFFCFYDLGGRSFQLADEVAEVHATQSLDLTGNYWLPKINGKAFFAKPPFKMLVSLGAVEIFGPSNWSYRFIDAFCGVLIAGLCFFFSIRFFKSPLMGFLSVAALFGSHIFIAYHGVRQAVQDSMLVFLCTLALVLFANSYQRAKTPALLIGLICGLAVLTKSAAGLIAPLIIAAFVLFSGQLLRYLPALIKMTLVCLLVGATYFGYHALLTPGAGEQMLKYHVLKRMSAGLHGTEQYDWTFYLIRIFKDNATVPGALLALSVLFGVYNAKDARVRFLLTWAVFPVALYSVFGTRFSWYIAAAIPGFALLVAWFLSSIFQQIGKGNKIKQGLCLALFFGGCFLLATHNLKVAQAIAKPSERHPMDLATHQIVELDKPAYSIKAHAPAIEEAPYINILKPKQLNVIEDLPADSFLITSFNFFKRNIDKAGSTSYLFLPPLKQRYTWDVIAYNGSENLSGFTTIKKVYNFGDPTWKPVYGFENAGTAGDLKVRRLRGTKGAVIVEADGLHTLRGGKIVLNISAFDRSKSEALGVDLFLNGERITSLAKLSAHLKNYEIDVPPGVFVTGNNVLTFKVNSPSGRVISERTQTLTANWLTLKLE